MDQENNIQSFDKWPLVYSGHTKLRTELSAHSSLDLVQYLSFFSLIVLLDDFCMI